MRDNRPFFVAGLWSDAPDPATGEVGDTHTLLITDANAIMRVHDGMPAILGVSGGASPRRTPTWDVVVDSRSVRAKRGGKLTGPNPTSRGKAGTNYHGVGATDSIPLAAVPSGPNLHDTRFFRHLLQLAQVVGAAIAKLLGDAGYDSADISALCLRHDIRPCIRKVGEPHGSGLGAVRYAVEHSCAWLLANKRLDRRQDRLGRVILALPTAACIFIVANRIGVF